MKRSAVQTLAGPGRPRPARPLARLADWLPRLEQAIARARTRRFRWGRHDCCLFACDCVRAMTGVDLARGFRGRYHSLRGAMKLLHEYGGLPHLAETIAARHALEEVLPELAQRGDIVLLVQPGVGGPPAARAAQGVPAPGLCFEFGPGSGAALAIVGLAGTHALAVAKVGITEIPLSLLWGRAWRIP